MTERRVSNPLALAVLRCLNERPMHPYEISTTLRTRGKEQSIKLNYGSLYAVVESLAKSGLVRPRETTREGRRPERTVYERAERLRIALRALDATHREMAEAGLPRLFLVESEYRERMLQAELDYVSRL